MSAIEYVDVLQPPRFEPSGEVKPVVEAVNDGNWLGAINLWIVRPGPALIYQQRPEGGWAPGKLDGSAAGYYRTGEFGLDGLREVKEELGRIYEPESISSLGRRLNVGVDSLGRERRAVISIYMTFDDSPLSSFALDPREVPAIFEVPTAAIEALFQAQTNTRTIHGISCNQEPMTRTIRAEDFSYMWDGYHNKIAKLAERFARGETVNY